MIDKKMREGRVENEGVCVESVSQQSVSQQSEHYEEVTFENLKYIRFGELSKKITPSKLF